MTEPDRPSLWSTVTGLLKESAALVGAVGTLLAAGVALLAFVAGNDDEQPSGRPAAQSPRPVVARLTGPGGMSERAFFTPRGMLVSTPYANQKRLSVVWTGEDGERRARVRVDPRSRLEMGFTLLRLLDETGPERAYEVRNGANLQPGEPVTAYISETAKTESRVEEVGASASVVGLGRVENLIVVGEVGRAGEGGTPLLDGRGRVVGMLFSQQEGVGRTMAIPIEDVRAAFPEAFD